MSAMSITFSSQHTPMMKLKNLSTLETTVLMLDCLEGILMGIGHLQIASKYL